MIKISKKEREMGKGKARERNKIEFLKKKKTSSGNEKGIEWEENILSEKTIISEKRENARKEGYSRRSELLTTGLPRAMGRRPLMMVRSL